MVKFTNQWQVEKLNYVVSRSGQLLCIAGGFNWTTDQVSLFVLEGPIHVIYSHVSSSNELISIASVKD